MSLTVRAVVDHLYRYLRKEQRQIPLTDPDLDDPLPEALSAINGALQEMSVTAPQFATRQDRSAHFRAPVTVAVTGLADGGYTATATWPDGAAGNMITLPGDDSVNRILYIQSGVATLHYPYLGDHPGGQASLAFDTVNLSSDVITVYDPVLVRGSGCRIRPANGKWNLQQPAFTDEDFGRRLVRSDYSRDSQAYFIGSIIAPNDSQPQLQMRLRSSPNTDLVLNFQARCSLGRVIEADVFCEKAIPVAADFTESLFLPLALMRFFASSVMRNVDAPKFVADQAAGARKLLEQMRPQAKKPFHIYPGL